MEGSRPIYQLLALAEDKFASATEQILDERQGLHGGREMECVHFLLR